MSAMTRITPDRLAEYFDGLTKRFFRDGSPEAVDVEVISPDWGDQLATVGARLHGITYDPHTNALELALDSGDHRVYQPRSVWTIEEPDGFASTIEVERLDGSHEIISVKRVGLEPAG